METIYVGKGDRMMFKLRKAILASSVIAVAAVALPTMAQATTLWVGKAAPKAPHNSCANPGYNTIQAALSAVPAGTAINVCAGTYEEQVAIEHAVSIKAPGGGVTIKLPAVPVDSTTPCDTEITEPQPNQDAVSICTTSTVSITGIKVEALWPAGTCYDSMYGIFVGGGATLKATNDEVVGAGASPINGCQGGVGIEVGTARPPGEIGHATLVGDTVSQYMKNGITAEFAGSSLSVTSTTVTGAGETPEIAQNGIQVSYGSKGTILKSTITGNECDNANCGNSTEDLTKAQAAGVLFYLDAKGSSVSNSTISENDIGAYQEAEKEENKVWATISGNEMKKDRYESVALGQGYTAVNKNKMTEGEVGIQLLQEEAQTFGPRGTGSEDEITEMSRWAVQGLSDLNAADKFGSFTITNSYISHNTGIVSTNNPAKLPITTTGSDT